MRISAAGGLLRVVDVETAKAAIEEIKVQGEGFEKQGERTVAL
jgi:hypothetical protein